MIDRVFPPISLSAIEHHLYCRRQCALIHVDGIWLENQHTVQGTRAHTRVDSGESKVERGRTVLRAIPLWSNRLGLTGRADAVEVWSDGRVAPVEYKSGIRHGDAAHLQLCAQALCLEEMLAIDVPIGHLWFGGTRRRVEVEFDTRLRQRTLHAIDEIRSNLVADRLPPPQHDERCSQCQFEPVCVPEIVEADQLQLRVRIAEELYECDS